MIRASVASIGGVGDRMPQMQVADEVEETSAKARKTSESLLAAFERTGDSCAFEELVRRHSPAVLATCRQVTRNTHDAEDATQAVFLTLAVQARTVNGIGNVGGWLQQVAKNTSLNICRSRRRRKAREQKEATNVQRVERMLDPHPAHAAGLQELRTLLRAEIDQLPTKYRLPLILHYFGGMKPREVAREINCTTQALAVRLFRARKMLADQLARRGLALGGVILSLTVVEVILGRLADSLSPTTAHAAEIGRASNSSTAGWINKIARVCAGAAMAGRFKLALFAVLLVGTALAQSLRGGSLRLPQEWQLRPLIHNIAERLRVYLHGVQLPQRHATDAPAPTPLTPIEPEALNRITWPNIPLQRPSNGADSRFPFPLIATHYTDPAFHDWLSTQALERTTQSATATSNGPVTLTGAIARPAAQHPDLAAPSAGFADAAPTPTRIEVATTLADGVTIGHIATPVYFAPGNGPLGGSGDAPPPDTSATIPTSSPGGIPEPTGLATAALALVLLARRRHRR